MHHQSTSPHIVYVRFAFVLALILLGFAFYEFEASRFTFRSKKQVNYFFNITAAKVTIIIITGIGRVLSKLLFSVFLLGAFRLGEFLYYLLRYYTFFFLVPLSDFIDRHGLTLI